jgi:drug/metabolite transporter (DMT)-like permease
MEALPFVAWRAFIAGAALLIGSYIVGTRVGGSSRLPNPAVLNQGKRRALLFAIVVSAVVNIALFAAYLVTAVGVVLIVFYTYPALVTLGAVRMYGERLDRVRVGALLVSSIGLAMVVLGPLAGATDLNVNPLGVALALLAAASQAGFVLIAGRGWAPMPTLHVSTIVVFAPVLLCLPLLFLTGQTSSLLLPFNEPSAWTWIIAGAFTGAAIPTVMFMTGIGYIGSSRTAILMTIEPLVGVTIAAAFLAEEPNLIQILGGIAVVVAAAVLQVAPRHTGEEVPQVEMGPLA